MLADKKDALQNEVDTEVRAIETKARLEDEMDGLGKAVCFTCSAGRKARTAIC